MDTWQILTELTEKLPPLIPLKNQNGGRGAAVLYGYRHALEKDFGR
jgi:hypothetical protein